MPHSIVQDGADNSEILPFQQEGEVNAAIDYGVLNAVYILVAVYEIVFSSAHISVSIDVSFKVLAVQLRV